MAHDTHGTSLDAGPAARTRALAALASEPFDAVVAGGGITGAAVARDAALRGLRVALVEREDVGSGTSSGSSKLAHGGLRYLKQGHLGLVRQSCREREILKALAPHLVERIAFLYPLYARGTFPGHATPPWMLHLGLALYDRFAGHGASRHRMLDPDAACAEEGAIRRDALVGCGAYFDATLDDARLTLATALGAMRAGAVVLTRTEATGVERDARGLVRAVHVRDREDGRPLRVEARMVVNAAGPFAARVAAALSEDEAHETSRTFAAPSTIGRAFAHNGEPPHLRLTQGVHLVLPHARLPLSHAVVMTSPDDGRMAFAIPWSGVILVGTTDTDIASPDDARVRASDVTYLLRTVAAAFPSVTIGPADVQATTVAVRPLVESRKKRRAAPSDVPREHVITVDASGCLTVAGGKLTTGRAVAEEIVDRMVRWLDRHGGVSARPCSTARVPLEGGDIPDLPAWIEQLRRRATLPARIPPPALDRIARAYGSAAPAVLARAREHARLGEALLPEGRLLAAEVAHMAEHEYARSVADVFARRTRLLITDPSHGRDAIERVGEILSQTLRWTSARCAAECAAYESEIARMWTWREEATTAGDPNANPTTHPTRRPARAPEGSGASSTRGQVAG
jgi:glycerol-3-phosphate dehydrogenase